MPDALGSQDILRGQSAIVQQGLDSFGSGWNNRQLVSQTLPEMVFLGIFPIIELPPLGLDSNPTLSQNRRPAQWDGSRASAGKTLDMTGEMGPYGFARMQEWVASGSPRFRER